LATFAIVVGLRNGSRTSQRTNSRLVWSGLVLVWLGHLPRS